MGATIFHVDLDAFYASVEQRDDPTLRGRPVIVGALPGHRGVVSACSYEARRFGVRSAMPISEAARRCPKGVFLPVRMDHYIEVSHRIMTILRGYAPQVQQISVDEAFLDLTGTERLLGDPLAAGREIKDRVREAERLTISIGIAPNRYLAKLASESGKPDGLVQVREGQEIPFLDGLRLKDLWGLGKKTLARLREAGITTVPELRALSERQLASLLGEGGARFLYGAARGADLGIHSEAPRSHSLSHEMTFEHDTADQEILRTSLLELSQLLIKRILEEDDHSRTVSLKLRTSDFETTTIQTTLPRPPGSAREIHRVALELLDKRWDGTTPVRLIGVGVQGSVAQEPFQGELFDQALDRERRIEQVALELSRKDATLTRASLLGRGRRGQREDPH
jgi:DNA polymerase IV